MTQVQKPAHDLVTLVWSAKCEWMYSVPSLSSVSVPNWMTSLLWIADVRLVRAATKPPILIPYGTVIEKTLLDFERNGLGLEESKRDRLKLIKQGKIG